MITHLEPDILECEVKWALGSITTNKAIGDGGIPVELFQILKDDTVKVLSSIGQKIWKTQQWPQGWKRSVFIPIPKKDSAKECSNYPTIALISHASRFQFSCSFMSDSLWSHELQHPRPPCPSPAPGVYLNPSTLSWWCHSAISYSVVHFSSCTQSFPASGSFQTSQLFTSSGQSIGVSASTSVLPMNIHDWSLGWTGWLSLQSKGLSRVFSNTIVQKHQFCAQLSLHTLVK